MRKGRGNEIGYTETQLMIPRLKRNDDHIITAPAPPEADCCRPIHAMWGLTWDIPPDADCFAADPGQSDFGVGGYWQMIVPHTTIVDRLSFWRVAGASVNSAMGFALYDMNLAADSFPLLTRTPPFNNTSLVPGVNTFLLTDRVTMEAGLYAVAYFAACFHAVIGIRNNVGAMLIANSLWDITSPAGALPRYGAFYSGFAPGGDFPDTLDHTTVVEDGSFDATSFGAIPLTYWDDTETYA